MKNTLVNLQSITTTESKAMSLEDIALQYKESLNPTLFASAFIKLHRMSLNLWKSKYIMFDEQDVVSWTLELVDKALLTYSPNKAKVSTYFQTLVYNRFRTEAQQLNTHKRKLMFYSSSYEQLVEDGIEFGSEGIDLDIKLTLEGYDLSERELNYCVLAANSYDNKTIAEKLKVSAMTISNIKKKLRTKLPQNALSI